MKSLCRALVAGALAVGIFVGPVAADPAGVQFVKTDELTMTSNDREDGLAVEIFNGSGAEQRIDLTIDLEKHDESVAIEPNGEQSVAGGGKFTWRIKFTNLFVGDYEDSGTLVASSTDGSIARLAIAVIAGKGDPVVAPVSGEWGPPFSGATTQQTEVFGFSPFGMRAADFSIPLRQGVTLAGPTALSGPKRWIAQASQPDGQDAVLISGLGGAGEYQGKVKFGDGDDDSTVLTVQVKDAVWVPLFFLAGGYFGTYWLSTQRSRVGPRRRALGRLGELATTSKKDQTKAQKVLDKLSSWPLDVRSVYTIWKPKRGWPGADKGTGYIADRAREADTAYRLGPDPSAAETLWGATGTGYGEVQTAMKKLQALNGTQLKIAELLQALEAISATDWTQILTQPVATKAKGALAGRLLGKDDFETTIADADTAKKLLVEYTRDYTILAEYRERQKDAKELAALGQLKTTLLSGQLATAEEAKTNVFDELAAHAPSDWKAASDRADLRVTEATKTAKVTLGIETAVGTAGPTPVPSGELAPTRSVGPDAPRPTPTARPRPSNWDRFTKVVRRRAESLRDAVRGYVDGFGLPDAIVVIAIIAAGSNAYFNNAKFGFFPDYLSLLGGGILGQGGLTVARSLIPKVFG